MTERVQGSSAGLPHSPPASLSGKTATKLPPLSVWSGKNGTITSHTELNHVIDNIVNLFFVQNCFRT